MKITKYILNFRMKISVIIGFYKRLDLLSMILQGLSKQTFKDFEVIIAEDNNNPNTIRFTTEFQSTVSSPIKVVQQDDIGFRKNKILNEPIKKSSGEVLVFFDGNCIPHYECLSQHYLNTKDKTILSGRRVMGCNFSVKKEGLLAVNGFDEDYVKASVGEYVDLELRLLACGYKLDSLKFKAIQYHIHHDSNYVEDDV